MSPGRGAERAPGRRGPRSDANRTVGKLSEEQLARKRENDRNAQRLIRQRNKERIEHLENQVKELKAKADERDVLATENAQLRQEIQRLADVERENAQLRHQLAMAGRQPFVDAGESAPICVTVPCFVAEASTQLGGCLFVDEKHRES